LPVPLVLVLSALSVHGVSQDPMHQVYLRGHAVRLSLLCCQVTHTILCQAARLAGGLEVAVSGRLCCLPSGCAVSCQAKALLKPRLLLCFRQPGRCVARLSWPLPVLLRCQVVYQTQTHCGKLL
jgi:hypothetical protein